MRKRLRQLGCSTSTEIDSNSLKTKEAGSKLLPASPSLSDTNDGRYGLNMPVFIKACSSPVPHNGGQLGPAVITQVIVIWKLKFVTVAEVQGEAPDALVHRVGLAWSVICIGRLTSSGPLYPPLIGTPITASSLMPWKGSAPGVLSRGTAGRRCEKPKSTTSETCLFLALKRSKVLVELALRPEPRPKARKATESASRTDEARDQGERVSTAGPAFCRSKLCAPMGSARALASTTMSRARIVRSACSWTRSSAGRLGGGRSPLNAARPRLVR
jgi:hypothetical protein